MTKKKSEDRKGMDSIIQIEKKLYKTPKDINKFDKFELSWDDSDSITKNVEIPQLKELIDDVRECCKFIIPCSKKSLIFNHKKIDSLEDKGEKKNKNYKDLFDKGFTLSEEGRHEEALAVFEEIIKIKSDQVGVWFCIGRELNFSGRYDEALYAFEKFISLCPDFDEAWFSQGNAFLRIRTSIEINISSYPSTQKAGHRTWMVALRFV